MLTGKLSAAIGVPKSSVERDLDVYRGLLNKLTQAKDLLKDFLERYSVFPMTSPQFFIFLYTSEREPSRLKGKKKK